MKAKSIKGKSTEEISSALTESMSDGFKPTLAIVFISVKQDNVWDAPFIGFFSYGEFGKSKKGKHEFHNNTCCVVALKER